MRRELVEAEQVAPVYAEALSRMGQLYAINADLPNSHALEGMQQTTALEQRFAVRQAKSAPLEPISELAHEDESAGEVKKAQKVLGLHLVADDEPTGEVKPSEEALHSPSSLVAPQFSPVLSRRPLATSTVRGNELHPSLVPQSLVERVTVVGFVSDEPLGQFVHEAVVQRGLQDFDLVG